jgi:small subunit ribosomal protein S14
VAKKSLIAKAKREPRFSVRKYSRCNRCGRGGGVERKFGLYQICLRDPPHEGVIPGMTKSSW